MGVLDCKGAQEIQGAQGDVGRQGPAGPRGIPGVLGFYTREVAFWVGPYAFDLQVAYCDLGDWPTGSLHRQKPTLRLRKG